MDKITFQNGESGGTPINATNLNQMQTNIENGISAAVERDILTARLTTDNQTMENASETIRFDEHSKIGSKLSFSDYGIKIGAGVSQILFSSAVSFSWNSPASGHAILLIKKNNKELVRINGSKPYDDKSSSTVCPPFLVSVSEGDVITTYIIGTTGLVIQQWRAFMTVEVVG